METSERRKEGLSRAAAGWMTRAEKLREGLDIATSLSSAPEGAAAENPQGAQHEEPRMEHPLARPPSPPPTPCQSGGGGGSGTAAAIAAAAATMAVVVPVLPLVAAVPDTESAPPPPYAAELPPPSFAESLAQLPGGAAAAATLAAETRTAATHAVDAVAIDAVCVAAVTATPMAATLVVDAAVGAAAERSMVPVTTSGSVPAFDTFECGERVEYQSNRLNRPSRSSASGGELESWIALFTVTF